MKRKKKDGRKDLQTTYSKKDYYLEYIKSSQNSVKNPQQINYKMGKICKRRFTEDTSRQISK